MDSVFIEENILKRDRNTEDQGFLMVTSPKINVYHVPDINGEKRVQQINFMSIFTSLRCFVSH